MPETLEDIERKILDVEADIQEIKKAQRENGGLISPDDKSLLVSYNAQLAELRKEKGRLVVATEAVPIFQAEDIARPRAAPRRELPYVQRWYVLYDFSRPAGMLANGIRNFLVKKFTGRLIGGIVFRAVLDGYSSDGQCIIIRACGEEEELSAMEDEVLTLADGNGDPYWQYSTAYRTEERKKALTTSGFHIAQSMYGAICGQNSDPQYDNKSHKRSASSRSSSRK